MIKRTSGSAFVIFALLSTASAQTQESGASFFAWLKDGDALTCSQFKTATTTLTLEGSAPSTECGYRQITRNVQNEFVEIPHLLFHPLSQFETKDLIPEIMKLKPGQAVPEAVYRKYSSKEIAITLVYKKFLDRKPGKRKFPATYDFLDGTELQMVFPQKYLELIEKNGFLNQHQINQSGGDLDRQSRAKSEDHLAGYKIEARYQEGLSVANEVRPKYSYFGLQVGPAASHPNFHENDRLQAGISAQYGDVVAVFNEDLKDRSTFTARDSLGAHTPGLNLRETNQTPLQLKGKDPSRHWEAQIWGPVKISDVHHFIVNCPGWKSVPEDRLQKLMQLRKPVYQCVFDYGNQFTAIANEDQADVIKVNELPATARVHPEMTRLQKVHLPNGQVKYLYQFPIRIKAGEELH